MRKVFISQIMKGKSDIEIKAERNLLIECAKEKFGADVEIIDSFFEGAPAHKKPLWFLGKSLEKLSDAESILMAPDWQNGRGTIIEHDAAKMYGIDIEYAHLNGE